jgi:hypothetical protein
MLALDSNMDHSLNTEAVAAEDRFDQFAAWCETDEGCRPCKLRMRDYKQYAALPRSSALLAPDMRCRPYPIDDLPICLDDPATTTRNHHPWHT